MRTSFIATPSPRRSNTPHKYYTRNNLHPASPNTPQRQGLDREKTPPTFLERRENLLANQERPDTSDDEETSYFSPVTNRAPKTKSLYKLVLNSFSWIGLTFLAINVYILSLCKKLWVWKHPFQSTGYNTDNSYVNYYRSGTPSNRPALASRLRTFISDSLPDRTRSHSSESSSSSEVGWVGFIFSLTFLSLLVYILGILMIPSPVLKDGSSGEIFSYIEDMKLVAVKVLTLESSLVKLDEKTVKSHEDLRSAITELENEREKLKSELVAIATLDRQQSSNIDELVKQNMVHSSRFEEVNNEIDILKNKQDVLRRQLETLKQSITTVSDLQAKLSRDTDKLSRDTKKLSLETSTIAQSSRENLANLQSTQETMMIANAEREPVSHIELGKVKEQLDLSLGEFQEELRGLTRRHDDMEQRQEDITSQDFTRDTETRVRFEEQDKLLSSYQEKIKTLESGVTRLSTQEVTADLLSRVETLSRDLDTVKSSDKMEEMLADIQGVREQLDSHVTRSDQQIKDVYLAFNVTQDQTSEERAASALRLLSIESKLAVMSALQARLNTIETSQSTSVSDKQLESEISKILSDMKNLEEENQGKLEELKSALSLISSDKVSIDEQITADIKKQADNIKTIKDSVDTKMTVLQGKLVQLETKSDNHIRRVVLEVLASTTQAEQDTRFFSDWLRANFLAREESDVRLSSSVLDKREVSNDTIALPSQDQIIQVIINELQTKHSINLSPGSGITVADIRFIVSEALQTFDEDKTGQADFALEALGGSVITVGCTETYYEGAPYASFMSVPLFRIPNPPNVALQSDITPGKCWAFKGSKGYMMIKLARAVQVEGFSMEHLPRKLSLSNDISSAPQRFQVRGLSHPNDKSSHHFGDYSYSDTGPALQHFTVQYLSVVAFEIVELEVESNHGHAEYTCLYRIRVHGKVPKLV